MKKLDFKAINLVLLIITFTIILYCILQYVMAPSGIDFWDVMPWYIPIIFFVFLLNVLDKNK